MLALDRSGQLLVSKPRHEPNGTRSNREFKFKRAHRVSEDFRYAQSRRAAVIFVSLTVEFVACLHKELLISARLRDRGHDAPGEVRAVAL